MCSPKSDWAYFNVYIEGAGKEFIFATCNKNTVCLLVYDWSLRLVAQIGQKNEPEKPFYLPNSFDSVKVKNDCYYIFGSNILRVFDSKSGQLVQSFKVSASKLLHIDSENRLIFKDSVNGLIFMDQTGHVLKKKMILNSNDLRIVSIENDTTLHGFICEEEGMNRKVSLKSVQI